MIYSKKACFATFLANRKALSGSRYRFDGFADILYVITIGRCLCCSRFGEQGYTRRITVINLLVFLREECNLFAVGWNPESMHTPGTMDECLEGMWGEKQQWRMAASGQSSNGTSGCRFRYYTKDSDYWTMKKSYLHAHYYSYKSLVLKASLKKYSWTKNIFILVYSKVYIFFIILLF